MRWHRPVDAPSHRLRPPGGHVGFVGVPHGVKLAGDAVFHSHVALHGGPAPVRRFLPELIDLVYDQQINPGKVFDLTLLLDQVADGYRAMDERRAIKALLSPQAADGARRPTHHPWWRLSRVMTCPS